MRGKYRTELGREAEDLVCRTLLARGYAILARRYRTRYGEIDIIARDEEAIVFVEVKARVSLRFGTPLEAVTSLKCRRIVRMAEEYVARRGLGGLPCRFDVAAVMAGPGGTLRVELVTHAFGADGQP